jgi:hypothetical protein
MVVMAARIFRDHENSGHRPGRGGPRSAEAGQTPALQTLQVHLLACRIALF